MFYYQKPMYALWNDVWRIPLRDLQSLDGQSRRNPFTVMSVAFVASVESNTFVTATNAACALASTYFRAHNCFKDKYKNNCPSLSRRHVFVSPESTGFSVWPWYVAEIKCFGTFFESHYFSTTFTPFTHIAFASLPALTIAVPFAKRRLSRSKAWRPLGKLVLETLPNNPCLRILQRVVDIMCNDCETKSHRRNWHFLGVQCPHCVVSIQWSSK